MIQRKQLELLSSVPEIKDLLDSIPLEPEILKSVDEARRVQIIDMLVDKFSANGLRPDDEPNDLGLAIEALIDAFNRD